MRVWEIRSRMRQEIAAACKPIADAIEAKYAPMIAEAEAAEANAERLLQEQQMRKALRKPLFPIGTKLYEWTNSESIGFRIRNIPWKKTGRVGFFDIYDERTEAPIQPQVGHAKPFIRLAKKDGTPGKKSSCRYGAYFPQWLPEGEHPDTYDHPAKGRGA